MKVVKGAVADGVLSCVVMFDDATALHTSMYLLATYLPSLKGKLWTTKSRNGGDIANLHLSWA